MTDSIAQLAPNETYCIKNKILSHRGSTAELAAWRRDRRNHTSLLPPRKHCSLYSTDATLAQTRCSDVQRLVHEQVPHVVVPAPLQRQNLVFLLGVGLVIVELRPAPVRMVE